MRKYETFHIPHLYNIYTFEVSRGENSYITNIYCELYYLFIIIQIFPRTIIRIEEILV